LQFAGYARQNECRFVIIARRVQRRPQRRLQISPRVFLPQVIKPLL
jgi:hypothetical protein